MAKLSNIRMSIFYLQQAIRNDYVNDERLLDALGILVENELREHETEDQKLQKLVDNINYNNMCARATLYPGVDIDDIPVMTLEEFKVDINETKTEVPEDEV